MRKKMHLISCDRDGCEMTVELAEDNPRPNAWFEVVWVAHSYHFCSAACLARWAVTEEEHDLAAGLAAPDRMVPAVAGR